MEEIRIYHSLWKNAPIILICFAFAAFGIRTLVVHPEKMGFGLWLGLLFFGLGGIFMLWLVLRERITGKPYYVVTDESVIMNSGMKAWEVRFADVERFFLTGKMIGIIYKKDREIQKMEDANDPDLSAVQQWLRERIAETTPPSNGNSVPAMPLRQVK